MKLVFQSDITRNLIHSWLGNSWEIVAWFFFHHRGSAIQKSLEGVLRSLILQILAPLEGPFTKRHRFTWTEYKRLREQLSDQYAKLTSVQGTLSKTVHELA